MKTVVVNNEAATTELVRPWRGLSPQQRVDERRARLLTAALEVFSAQGFHGAKVRDVCRAAGLTERYFYESFTGKQALLIALAEQLVADLVTAAAPGIALVETDLDAAVGVIAEAVVGSLTDDPRRARILFVEVVGVSTEIEDRRRVIIAALADVVRQGAARAFGPWVLRSVELELMSRALIGAAQELLVAYVRDELPLDRPALVEIFGRLLAQVGPTVEAMAEQQSVNEERTPS